jgi:hypothetical protein
MSIPEVFPEPERVPHLTHVTHSPHVADVTDATGAAVSSSRGIWWTKRAVGLHLTLILVVPAFLALFWWQVERVRQGNTLSWAYVFEWPFFAGYAVYLWWKLLHDGPVGRASAAPPEAPEAPAADRAREDADDEQLAAYNRYLADLHASGRPKRW